MRTRKRNALSALPTVTDFLRLFCLKLGVQFDSCAISFYSDSFSSSSSSSSIGQDSAAATSLVRRIEYRRFLWGASCDAELLIPGCALTRWCAVIHFFPSLLDLSSLFSIFFSVSFQAVEMLGYW
jgi:hypothetical protein